MKDDRFETLGGRTGHYEELKPVFAKQQSFGGKAELLIYDNSYDIELKSFGKEVIGRLGETQTMFSENDFDLSETTKRHINDFVRQYGDYYARKEFDDAGSVAAYVRSLPDRKTAEVKEKIFQGVRALGNDYDKPEAVEAFGKNLMKEVSELTGPGGSVTLIDTDEFSLSSIGGDVDAIALLANKTNDNLVLSFPDGTAEHVVIEPNAGIVLHESDGGCKTIGSLLAADYAVNDPEVVAELFADEVER